MSEIWSALEGGVVGVAVGTAAATAIEPALEPERQEAWKKSQARILDLNQLAALVAQALQSVEDVLDDAERNGFHRDQLLAAIQLALKAPAPDVALRLYRRNEIAPPEAQITLDQVKHALAKAGLEYQYWPAILHELIEPLDSAVIANAIVRGVMQAPFDLPYEINTEPGKVQPFPQSKLDAKAEAAATGIDTDRLFVQTAIAGRPMSPEEAAKASFRGIVDRSDYDRAIAEGDIRSEYRDAIYEFTRQILTAHDAIEDHLRGWSDQAAMYAQTARHGMSTEDTDVLFRITGRPLSFHQVFIGLRRGGSYDGPTGDLDPAFLKSLQESNIRPEWYNLAWSQRYTYPSAFVLRALTQAGTLSQSDTEKILLYEGWEPTLATQVSTSWAGAPSTTPKPKKLTNATIRSALRKGKITGEQALADLEANGLSPADAAIYLES